MATTPKGYVLSGSDLARTGKAVRDFESRPPRLPVADGKHVRSASRENIVVPRSGPDGDGFYTVDIYVPNDIQAGTYTQIATGQKARMLPATL